MARVVVAGWVGSTNLGDELVLRALLRKLDDRGATAVAVSTDPAATRAMHGIAAVDHRRLDELVRGVRSADAMLFGGGGLLQDVTSRFNLPYHLSRVAIARRHGVPVAMLGVGAGPLTTRSGRAMVRRALGGTVPGTVRDRDSASLLAEVGLQAPEVAADPAIALPTPPVARLDRVAVCLRPWHGGGVLPVARSWDRGLAVEGFVDAMAAALDELAGRTGLGIHFVAFQAGRDDRLHELVADRMDAHATSASPGLDDVLAEVAAARAVVSVRYHGAVAATIAGLPSVMVGYSDKVRSLAAELGGGCRLVGWSRAEVAAVPALVADVLGSDDQVASVRDALRQRDRANDAALDRLLEAAAHRVARRHVPAPVPGPRRGGR